MPSKPTSSEEVLKKRASDLLTFTYESVGADDLYQALKVNHKSDVLYEPVLRLDEFRLEFSCVKLALGCHLWERFCLEQGVERDEDAKIFLQLALESFKSPKNVDLAKTFSEYFCAPEEDLAIGLTASLAAKLVARLKIPEDQLIGEDKTEIPPIVYQIILALESFSQSYEEKFQDLRDAYL